MTTAQRPPAFPCERLPDDGGSARLLGLYPQLQKGFWMQRVKILGGVLTAEQWRGLGEIAREHTPDTPLHLTTRQEIEFHDVPPDSVPNVQRAMAELDLTGLGACGDTLRNVIICPCAGVRSGTCDLSQPAWAARRTLENTDGVFFLPRKFKIVFSCSSECRHGDPWINDLGFVLQGPTGERTFRVIGAGSLGARPSTGIELARSILPEEVLPFVLGAIRLFAAEGNRANRRRARLRHVRERMGDEAFLARLGREFAAARMDRDWPAVELPEVGEGMDAELSLTMPNGDVTPDTADSLGALADRDDVRVCIGLHHRISVFAADEESALAAVSACDLASPSQGELTFADPQPSVVACPGKRWCPRGLVHTNEMADAIRREFATRLSPQTTVCISGCPNGCAHTAVGHIGLSGVLKDGREAFDMYAGGGLGRNERLAELVQRRLRADEVLREIDRRL